MSNTGRALAALFVVAFGAGYVRAGSNTGTTAGGSAVTVTSGTIAATQSGSWTSAVSGTVTANQGGAPWSTTISGTPSVTVASGSLTCSGPLTDTQLRAVAVPVSGTFWPGTQPVSGTFWQATQPVSGAFFQATQPVSLASSVAVTGTFWQATQPVSGTFWQATQPVSGPVTDAQLRASPVPVSGTFWQATQPVSGTFWQATQPISAAALPLPSGAATSGKQPALGTAGAASADVITVQGIAGGVAQPVSGTFWQATQPVSGTFWQATQPVSGPATDVQLRATPLPVSGTVTANQGGAPWAENITQLGGATLVNGGLAGSLAMGGTAATNAAITQKPLLIGAEALSTQPVAATTGNQRQLVSSLDGALYTRTGGPVSWSCGLDNIGATLTQCQAAPASGLKLYITDISIQSTTATLGLFLIRYGTGSNCATGTTSILPSAATVPRFGYPANTVSVGDIHYTTPISAAAANAICIICTVTNTCTVQMSGYTAP